MDDRPTVDQYFMDMTHLVKSRGTCPRRQVGAVIVKDKRVLTTGYNGAPRNFPHPTDVGCIRDELGIPSGMMADVCPCLHAEQNAILQAATTGVSIEGGDIYCTTQPCTQCSRMIANCGLRRVIFEHEYADPLSIGLLVTAGVELWKWDPEAGDVHRYGQSNTFEQAQEALRQKWRDGAFTAAAPKAELRAEIREALGGPAGGAPAPGTGSRRTKAAASGLRPAAGTAPRIAKGDPVAGGRTEQAPADAGRPHPQTGSRNAAPVPRTEPEEAPSSPAPPAVRGIEHDPDREEVIRRMIQERKDRLQRALDERR